MLRTVNGAWKAMLALDAGKQCGREVKNGQGMLDIRKRPHGARNQFSAVRHYV